MNSLPDNEDIDFEPEDELGTVGAVNRQYWRSTSVSPALIALV